MMYDDELLYKLWLNIQCGHDPQLIDKCLKKFGSAKEIFNSDSNYKSMLSGIRIGRVLAAKRTLEPARELAEYCEENGIKIIAYGDAAYPKRLGEIFAPPQILYVRGELPDIDNLVCVTIVGSRECSDYGRKFTNRLAYELGTSGIVVISGMAAGVDSAAHNGALNSGNVSVAALAGGVDIVYPKSNTSLYKRLTNQGAVISERPPQTVGRRNFYRERNRILVGLSNGVLIVEGEKKSGTNLTATWAGETNRDLFAVPGRPDDKGSELPNELIKENAKLVTSAADIIEEYISVYPTELKNGIELIDETKKEEKNISVPSWIEEKPREKTPDFEKYEGNSRIILEYLYKNKEEVHIDQISSDCNIEITEMSFLLIQLLMERAIEEHPGEYYSVAL